MVDWKVDERSRTLRIEFDDGSSPSRDEIDGFLRQVAPLLETDAVRRVSVNGEPLVRRRSVSVDDVALPVRYAAAQQRVGERWASMWRRRSAS